MNARQSRERDPDRVESPWGRHIPYATRRVSAAELKIPRRVGAVPPRKRLDHGQFALVLSGVADGARLHLGKNLCVGALRSSSLVVGSYRGPPGDAGPE